jgi:predicted metal-dependent HD superfamily phosphohydrolase
LSETDPPDTPLLIDLDLAVLARPATDYDRYTAAIRKEYWMVPGFVYRKERTRVLAHLLDRPTIYQTPYGRKHYEAPARENLWRELRELA